MQRPSLHTSGCNSRPPCLDVSAAQEATSSSISLSNSTHRPAISRTASLPRCWMPASSSSEDLCVAPALAPDWMYNRAAYASRSVGSSCEDVLSLLEGLLQSPSECDAAGASSEASPRSVTVRRRSRDFRADGTEDSAALFPEQLEPVVDMRDIEAWKSFFDY